MTDFRTALIGITLLGLVGCAQAVPTTPTANSAISPSSVCADIAAVKAAPDAALALARLDPHSAFGVVWADAQSGCDGVVPAAGVNATWTAEVWAMVKTLAPTVLPILIGLI